MSSTDSTGREVRRPDRRDGDRRNVPQPFDGEDRRVTERRSGADRRRAPRVRL